MKITTSISELFLIAVIYLILGGAQASLAAPQEAVTLPAFSGSNILFLERYPYDWNIPAGSSVRTQLLRLSDRDVIHVSRQRDAAPPARVEFVLGAGSLVSWWKGITFYKKITFGRDLGKWRRVRHVFTENGARRSQTITIDISQFVGGAALTLEKAKAFGAHTPMYVIFLESGRDDLAGQRITFLWEKDR